MKAPKPPPTPDPYATAGAQQMANVEVAIANTFLQNADEDRPDGSVRWDFTDKTIVTQTYDAAGLVTGTRTLYKPKKVVTLTTEGQTQYDQQQQIAIAMNAWALAQTGILSAQQAIPVTLSDLTGLDTVPVVQTIDTDGVTAGSLTETIGSTNLTAHLATIRDVIDARLQYQVEVDRAARIVALSHMGLAPGMTAYDRDLDAFDKQSTDARNQAWLTAQQEQTRIVQLESAIGQFKNDVVEKRFAFDSKSKDDRNNRRVLAYNMLRDRFELIATLRQQQLQEKMTIRTQNINEISSLMHGGQLSLPQFQGFNPGKIDRTPVMDAVYQSAAMDMQKWQVKVQSQQAMFGGLLGLAGNMAGGMMALSDRRLKTDIEQIEMRRGVQWYTYRYLWDATGTVRSGVMAQEVPWAAVEMPGGWLAVDYGRL